MRIRLSRLVFGAATVAAFTITIFVTIAMR
jgi:hypothetical protein